MACNGDTFTFTLLLRMSPTDGDETLRGRNPENGRPLLRMSPTAGDETLRGRNPDNGRPLLRMSPTAGDETSRGRNPENERRSDFGRNQDIPTAI